MNYAYWYSKRSSNGNLPGSNDIAPSLHVMRTGSHLSTPFPDLSTAKFLSDWKELKCMNLDNSYTCGGARNTELVECSSNISCGVHHWKRKKGILKQENARYKFINTLFLKIIQRNWKMRGPWRSSTLHANKSFLSHMICLKDLFSVFNSIFHHHWKNNSILK